MIVMSHQSGIGIKCLRVRVRARVRALALAVVVVEECARDNSYYEFSIRKQFF